MKKNLLLIGLVASIVLISNCGDDKTPGIDDPLTSEENKTLLQSVGVELTRELAGLSDTEGVQALISLSTKINVEDEEEFPAKASLEGLVKVTNNIVAFSYGEFTTIEFGHTAYRVNEDEAQSLQEIWDEALGTHEWNPQTEEFDFTAGGSTVIVRFPAEDGGTTNNAVLTFSNYQGTVIESPISGDYDGDLPVSMDLGLSVDESNVMSYSFDIEYGTDGIPELVETELILDPFSLSVELINTVSTIGATVNLSNSSTTLIEISTDVNGDFSDEAIDAVEIDEDEITNVINDGSFSVTLLTLKIEATMNFASLYNALDGVDTYYDKMYGEGPQPNFETNAATLEAALANFTSLTASYTDTNKKAADVEWYTLVNEDEYEIWIELGARMVFEDGSKVDLEDYLGAGFDELESEINNLLGDIADDLGEDFEPFEF